MFPLLSPVPFMGDGEQDVAIFSSKAVVGLKVRDGQELWRYPWVTKWDLSIVDPILVGDRLFISSMDRGCALLQLGRGQPTLVWATKAMRTGKWC